MRGKIFAGSEKTRRRGIAEALAGGIAGTGVPAEALPGPERHIGGSIHPDITVFGYLNDVAQVGKAFIEAEVEIHEVAVLRGLWSYGSAVLPQLGGVGRIAAQGALG